MLRRITALCLGGTSVLALAGCMVVGPDPVAPAIETPPAYVGENHTESWDMPEPDATVQAWWETLDDPALTELLEAVRSENLDVESAFLNLALVRQQEIATRANLFPTLDAFLDENLSFDLSDGDGLSDNTSLGLGLSYDVDIAGRNQRQLEAAQAAIEAAYFNLQNIQRLITQTAAQQYIELKRTSARLALLDTTLELQQRTLDIVNARFEVGIAPALDVDRAASDLAQSRSQRFTLEAARETALFSLNLLRAGYPEPVDTQLNEIDETVPVFASYPDPGIPADLIRNRPDVRAAEAELVAELARIGVEEADLYPSLTLPGQISASAGNGDLLSSAILSVGASLDLPIFDAGRRKAEVEAQRIRAEAALVSWRSSILTAVVEVESALTQIDALERQLEQQEIGVERSESAYRQLDALYREGLSSFIDVLDAQRTLISRRESIINTRAQLASSVVELYAALGYSGENAAG
ncbi:efflux transporter outer membrane subunit [Ponticaulis profundi]|uniref:Efflux transporter outer membrane subunit n=1 Tax=Ponticaulis profundi TaxID=2665222 RepID=A0ABW1SAU0_9PROT